MRKDLPQREPEKGISFKSLTAVGGGGSLPVHAPHRTPRPRRVRVPRAQPRQRPRHGLRRRRRLRGLRAGAVRDAGVGAPARPAVAGAAGLLPDAQPLASGAAAGRGRAVGPGHAAADRHARAAVARAPPQHRHSTGGGHLYQGTYKSFPVQDDPHLPCVNRYVERNALRAGLVGRAQDWRWCSLWRRECGGPGAAGIGDVSSLTACAPAGRVSLASSPPHVKSPLPVDLIRGPRGDGLPSRWGGVLLDV